MYTLLVKSLLFSAWQLNHPKFNQRRVSCVKFLGELYNYRLVESSVIFKTLYSFITFGVSLDGELPIIFWVRKVEVFVACPVTSVTDWTLCAGTVQTWQVFFCGGTLFIGVLLML